MPVNGMTVGMDYTLSYFDANTNAIINLGDVQSVDIKSLKHLIKSMPFNAPPKYGYIPDGYQINFTITRAISTLEDLMATFEANFNADKIYKPGYLNETIQNADGTISRYQYTNCVIYLDDHGVVSRERTVTLRLEAYASSKIKIA